LKRVVADIGALPVDDRCLFFVSSFFILELNQISHFFLTLLCLVDLDFRVKYYGSESSSKNRTSCGNNPKQKQKQEQNKAMNKKCKMQELRGNRSDQSVILFGHRQTI
jgi:hypothetical protein